jgi:hypothetical protein
MNNYRRQVMFRPLMAVCMIFAAAVAAWAASSEIGEKATRQTPQTIRPTVSGVVLDEGGKTVEGAFVKLGPDASCVPARTGADGRFALPYNPTAWRWPDPNPPRTFVIAWHTERRLAAAVLFKGNWRKTVVEVRMRPAASLAGRVVDPEGKGIQDAEVTVWFTDRGCGTAIGPPDIRTDSQGRYEAQGLPAGFEYRLSATAQGHGDAGCKVSVPDVSPLAAPVEAEELVLPLASLSVSGVVLRRDGTPAGGAAVRAWGEAVPDRMISRDERFISGDDGRFTFDGLVAAPVVLYAVVESENLSGRVTVDAGSEGVRLILTREQTHVAPPAPKSLVGGALPDFTQHLPLDFDASVFDGKAILVCVYDVQQRASLQAVKQAGTAFSALARNDLAFLAFDVSGLCHHASALWANDEGVAVTLAMGFPGDDETLAQWGVKALPWLLLADKDHVVRAEGFAVDELEEKVNRLAAK